MRTVPVRLLATLVALGLSSAAHAQHDHHHAAPAKSRTAEKKPDHAHDAKHDHGHAHHGESARPVLNDGKKWQTDPPLRKGMENIKKLVEAAVEPIHSGKMTNEGFEALGKKVDAEIANIFANCKLAPAADAVLHGVLATIMHGSELVKTSEGKRSAGVVKMIEALDSYGSLFEHPGWTKVKH